MEETILASHFPLDVQLQWIGRALLANEQGGPLAQLRVIPRQPPLHQTLGAVVIHAAAVLLCRQRVDVLQPFTNMFNNPAVLAVSTLHCWHMLTLSVHSKNLLHYAECLPSHDARRFSTRSSKGRRSLLW